MALRLKTKFTLAMALLVLGIAVVTSAVFAATLVRSAIQETSERARSVTQNIYVQAQHALVDAAATGAAPDSEAPEDVREYVRRTLIQDSGLISQLDAAIGYSKNIYEISVVDHAGTVLISSDSSLQGQLAPRHTPFEQLQNAGFLEQLRELYGPQRVYEVSFGFNINSQPFGSVRVGLSSIILREEITRRMKPVLLLAGAAVLISTLLAAAVSTASLAPLTRISSQLDRIAAGEEVVAPVNVEGELGQVSLKISNIARQLRDSRKEYSTREEEQLDAITLLRVSERLAARARLTANVAHEVKNPLNSMRLWLEHLKSSPAAQDESTCHAIEVLDAEIDRLDRVVKRLLEFHRPAELNLENASVTEILESVIHAAQPSLKSNGIELVRQWDGDVPPVHLDRQQMRQAVLNLVVNAIEAMPNGGKLTIRLQQNGDHVELFVADTGSGIPPELQAKVFQLFFTTRPGGSGIGLATTARIVQDHNGSIDFSSLPGQGTTFQISLPVVRPAAG